MPPKLPKNTVDFPRYYFWPDLFATDTFAAYTRLLPSFFAACIFRYPDFFKPTFESIKSKILFLFIYWCIFTTQYYKNELMMSNLDL